MGVKGVQTDLENGITLFRNLYIDNKTRNPKVKGLNKFVNNVVYNWGVKAADEGETGVMVILERVSDDPYQCATAVKNVHKVSNVEKLVARKWINKEGTYVTEEFLDYVRPLIQGDYSPVMVEGLPRHLYHNNKW